MAFKYKSTRYLLAFHCPTCSHEWVTEWSTVATDDCSECGTRDVDPSDYENISDKGIRA